MASNPYVNKVEFGDQTVMDISDTDATASDVLSGKKFYLGSGAPALGTAIGGIPEEELRDTVGWTGKNLLENIATTQTVNGITFTVNSDKSITVNGTASADTQLHICSNTTAFNDKDLVMSGCPSGGSENTYEMFMRVADSADVYIRNIHDTGNGARLISDIRPTGTNLARIAIFIKSGYTANNLVFHPMLRLASIADATYEPYHESVEQCKFDRAEQRVLGAKNLLPLEISKVKAMNEAGTWSGNSYTRKGITYNCNVVNGFITQITASGTASEDAVIDLLKTPAEGAFMRRNVTLSGCPFGGSTSTYFVNAYRIASTDGSTGTKEDTGNGVTFDFLNDGSGTKASISIVIRGGITANNLVFAPMLRLASDPDNTYVPYAMTNKELTDSLDGWTATAQVANGEVTFSGLDDTQGWGYDPRIWVDNNSTNLNPYCRINSMTGAGTASMSITYDTDADNGAYVKLRILK